MYLRMKNRFSRNLSDVICGEMFDTGKEFLEHCYGHRFSPPDELFRGRPEKTWLTRDKENIHCTASTWI